MEQELRSLSGSGGSYGSNGGSSVTDTAELMTRNPWQRLVYLAMTDDFTRKFFLWWGVRHYSVNTLRIQGRMNKPLWLSGQAFSLESDRARAYAKQVDAFFNGVDVFKSWLWPLTTLALWPSEESLFIAKPLSGFVGFGYLLGAPFLLGLFTMCWQLVCVKHFKLNLAGVQTALSQPSSGAPRSQDILWLLNPDGHLLNKATDYLRWQRFDKSDEPNEPAMQATTEVASHIVTGIKKNIVAQHRVARLAGIRALAKIVAAMDSHDIRFLETLLNPHGADDKADAHRLLQRDALQALKAVARKPKFSMAARFYAQYQLWKLGYAKVSGYDALFSVWALFLGFAKYQYLQAVAEPFLTLAHRSLHHVPHRWINETVSTPPCADYLTFINFTRLQKPVCNWYGVVPEVYFNHIEITEQALNDVLQVPQQSMAALMQKLPIFTTQPAYSLDLSQQSWWHFPAQLWGDLRTASWGNMALNISAPVSSGYTVAAPDAMKQFLWSRNWTSFDWHHARLNQTWQAEVFAGLPATLMRYLDLSQTGITDVKMPAVANLIARARLLETLKLQRFNANITALSEAYTSLPLTDLVLGHSDWTDDYLATAMKHLPRTLTTLNLGGVPLAGPLSLASVANAASRYASLTLSLENAQLTDTVFNTFATAMGNSTVLSLDLSHNTALSLPTVEALIQSAGWPLLQQLYLAKTSVSDVAMTQLAPALSRSILATLDVGNTALSSAGLMALAEHLPQSHLLGLRLAGNQLFGPAVDLWVKNIPASLLTQVDVSGCGLMDAVGAALINAFASTNITGYSLNLANNYFSKTAAVALVNTLKQNPHFYSLVLDANPWPSDLLGQLPVTDILHTLSCNSCGANANAAVRLLQQVQGSALQSLSLEQNSLNPAALIQMACRLVQTSVSCEAMSAATTLPATYLGLLSATPATNLTHLSLANNNITAMVPEIFGRVLTQTHIASPRDINLSLNNTLWANVGRVRLWPAASPTRQLTHFLSLNISENTGNYGMLFMVAALAIATLVTGSLIYSQYRNGLFYKKFAKNDSNPVHTEPQLIIQGI